jgi:formylglycine-generating enzyme required for sulfatase activity
LDLRNLKFVNQGFRFDKLLAYMILKEFEFKTVKISDEGEIEYFSEKGNYLALEIDKTTTLILVLASKDLMKKEACLSESSESLGTSFGSNNQVPSFLISQYPVTQKQYYKVTGDFQTGGNLGLNKPVLVSWIDAIDFCDRLSRKEGREYRLPYESEWEFACCAGSKDSFCFGNLLTSDLANFGKDPSSTGIGGKSMLHPLMEVGKFPPNDFGIYDLHGNVWEWCNDNNPFPDSPSLRIVKGGAFYSEASSCSCFYQGKMRYEHQNQVTGFRIVSPL